MVAVANVNETLPSLSFLSSSGFLAIVPSTSARLTKTTVQLSNIDAGAGGISLTANDKHSNDKHADNNLTNQSDNNPANQASNNPANQSDK
jgi:hypothetical protein